MNIIIEQQKKLWPHWRLLTLINFRAWMSVRGSGYPIWDKLHIFYNIEYHKGDNLHAYNKHESTSICNPLQGLA